MTKSKLYLVLSPVLALLFVAFGVQKIPAENPIFSIIAENSGIALFEPYIRLLTGAAEVLAAAFLLFARTRMTGAVLGLAILISAVGFHLSPWLGISPPGIGHGLFIVAVLMLALSLINVILLRKAGENILFLQK